MKVKLDRVLGDGRWMKAYKAAHAYFPKSDLSDHCPAIIYWSVDVKDTKFSFIFLNMWIKIPGSCEIVQQVWNSSVEGYPMFRVTSKLKIMKPHLKAFHKRATSNSGQRVNEARNELLDLQGHLRNSFSAELKMKVDRCMRKLKRLAMAEELFLKQLA
ncbi:hypothetical protein Drorol1_Dr00011207 [Drosera rotundifolia]